jgi:hypothetical protein
MKKPFFYYKSLFVIALVAFVLLGSCKKEFLDKKPVMGNLIPKNLADFEGLLNNYMVINNAPGFSMFCADEYEYLSSDIWQAKDEVIRNCYNWKYSVYQSSLDWNNAYKILFYANTIITGINELEKTAANSARYGDVKGQAYFLRAHTFFQLAQVFAMPYDAKTAAAIPGIPLPLEVNANKPLPRASLAATYAQILSDLETAKASFSSDSNMKTTLGSKVAAMALLARVHLGMMNYDQAMENAGEALKIKGTLLDYNTLDENSNTPFEGGNPEVLYSTTHGDASVGYDFYALTYPNYGYTFKSKVSPKQLALYDSNDRRLKLYFFARNTGDPDRYIKALYQNTALGYVPFCGLATDEVYLILAECLARKLEVQPALDILNKLAEKRFPAGLVPVLTAPTPQAALDLVLLERRRELLYRGARWFDVRRLNVAGANITLSRDIDGVVYMLPPNDPRYALPIPLDEITKSGISQN